MEGDATPAEVDPFGIVGTIFERKYAIDRAVAHGGFGVVYHGRHLSLGSDVALKILKPRVGADDDVEADLVAQFLDEAKTLARLRHPNVVTVLDGGVAHLDGFAVAWMALEWLDGETLRDDLVARRGRGGRTPYECFELLRPVLEAMAAAHDAGIVHRDLKPSNVMLVPTGGGCSARVLDFGIAKIVDATPESTESSGQTETRSHVSAFTPASAAPEQLSGTRTGPPTDVFALALMLVEVLADKPPIPENDPNARYGAVFSAERPTPRSLGIDVGAWEAVLDRALAVRPSDRQANARALLRELDSTLNDAVHQPFERRTESPATTIAPPAPERSWLGRGVAIAAVAVTIAGVIGIRALRSRSTSAPAIHEGPSASECSARACSRALGEPAICARDRCVALASEDCVVRAEPRDLERDDTVWIGSMFPRTGANAADDGVWNHHAMELARRDFSQVMGGVPKGRARPLAVLECDDAANATRAAKHLTEDVGVPAVIGFRSGIEAIELTNEFFVPRGVLTIAATNTNPMLTKVPQATGSPHMVFRTTFSSADAAAAVGALVHDVVEPELRALPGLATAPVRLATLRAKGAAGADIADALRRQLRFNDKSAVENGATYQELSYEFAAEDGDPELARIAAALIASRTEIVVYAGARAAARGIIAPVERHWPAGVVRPRWISMSELPAEVLTVIDAARAPGRRFFGVTPLPETSANARFVQHYRETFDEPVTRTDAPNSTYDAFYLVALASYAIAAEERVTGIGLSRAVAHLVPPGPEVEVGVPGIFDAYAKLSTGGGIDFTGATGKLDFDLATGEAPFDYAVLCTLPDASGRSTGVESGLVYAASAHHLEGAMRCGR